VHACAAQLGFAVIEINASQVPLIYAIVQALSKPLSGPLCSPGTPQSLCLSFLTTSVSFPRQARGAAAVKRACAEAAHSHGLGAGAAPGAKPKNSANGSAGAGAGAGKGAKGGAADSTAADLNLILFDEVDVVFAEVRACTPFPSLPAALRTPPLLLSLSCS